MSEVTGAPSAQPTASAEVSGSEVDSGSEELSGDAPLEATPAQKKKIKQLKLKFNGKEMVEDLPFEIDEDQQDWYIRQLQKGKLADHKSNEFSQLEKEVGAFIAQLRDPKTARKALANPAIGLDIKELAASILQEEIERSQKSPEQLRAEEAEARLEELKSEREREKEEAQARELERLTEREFERYDNLMSSALESSDLPKSPYIVKKMTEYMIMAVENNIDIDPKDIVPIIRQEYHKDISEMFGGMPAEVIEQVLGKDTINKLKSHRKAKAQPPVPVRSAVSDVARKPTEERKPAEKKTTIKDFFGV